MNILALDLGTKCGWAIDVAGSTTGGVWDLKPSTFDSAGQRYIKFRKQLDKFSFPFPEITVVYEEVRAHVAVDAAHVYGGLMATLQTWCLQNEIEYKGIPVGTIKKHATGKGNAKKPDMIKAASKLFPNINVIDDNLADALCLLHYAQSINLEN